MHRGLHHQCTCCQSCHFLLNSRFLYSALVLSVQTRCWGLDWNLTTEECKLYDHFHYQNVFYDPDSIHIEVIACTKSKIPQRSVSCGEETCALEILISRHSPVSTNWRRLRTVLIAICSSIARLVAQVSKFALYGRASSGLKEFGPPLYGPRVGLGWDTLEKICLQELVRPTWGASLPMERRGRRRPSTE